MTAGAARARAGGGAPGLAVQLFGYLGAPSAYALHLLASTALVPLACGMGATWPLHLLTAAVVALIVASLAAAWRVWRAPRGAGATPDRQRFLGVSGLMLGVLSLAIVLFSELPNHLLDPCLP